MFPNVREESLLKKNRRSVKQSPIIRRILWIKIFDFAQQM